MKDEEYVFVSDVIDKKTTARSARNQRTHTGKGGRVRFPSDNLSKKELAQMSGECKSYRLNDPMTWVEFKSMPDDLKCTYIKLLRQKFNVPDCKIADMFGVDKVTLSRYLKTLGCSAGRYSRGKETVWDVDGWTLWVTGEPTGEEVSEPFMEEDVAAWEDPNPKTEEPDHIDPVPVPYYEVTRAIPYSGSMDFEGDIGEVLETVAVLLGGAYVKVCISWEVCQGGAEKR